MIYDSDRVDVLEVTAMYCYIKTASRNVTSDWHNYVIDNVVILIACYQCKTFRDGIT